MNPNAIAILWAFTLLMAGAIALGPAWILGVGAAVVVFTIAAVIAS